mgnify:CR=1 FL=1
MAETLSIGEYLFMGSATSSGIFVDIAGGQVGVGFTGTSNTTAAQALWEIAGLQAHPSGAVGALINVSADVYYCAKGGKPNVKAHFVTNYSTMYPKQAGPAYNLSFGKVQ